MNRRIIFIGGIHGVGKGTVSKAICSQADTIHLSASDLIKWNEVSADEKNKKVENILGTQERLINELNFAVQEGKTYLLDGHFCLLNKNNEPEKVPFETFKKIAPIIIAVVVDDIAKIVNRLNSRDGKNYDFITLNNMQHMEVDYANELSVQLNTPFIIIKNGDPNELMRLIEKTA